MFNVFLKSGICLYLAHLLGDGATLIFRVYENPVLLLNTVLCT